MSKGKDGGAEAELPLVEGFVWVCLAVAVLATAYVLMKEPEDSSPKPSEVELVRYLSRFELAALGASGLAALAGLWRVLSRGAGQGLFGMAVLFNVVLACFWALRFLLAP
ncbi:MAG: hypothetical protein FJ290_06950 [Planctomycetes bacterium]|nr:hypothetical protein [Planctomycetota bacterium]